VIARKTAVVDAVLAGANETDATPGQATIAWAPGNRVLPISESAQLADNLGVAQLVLTAEQVAQLDAASAAPALEQVPGWWNRRIPTGRES
jgi:aryl-alcohol dehydrogenase-like predicted oxidoreductase